MIKSMEQDNQAEMYSKSAVEVTYNISEIQDVMVYNMQTRLKAIRRMEDALAAAVRLGEHETTEV